MSMYYVPGTKLGSWKAEAGKQLEAGGRHRRSLLPGVRKEKVGLRGGAGGLDQPGG